jgi:acetyl esterase
MAKSLAPPPIAQLLIYPTIDWSLKHPSHGLFGSGFLLTSELMDWFGLQYVGKARGSEDLGDPRISPLKAEDVSGLPPAVVVTAGFDPLRDEGEAYGAKLKAAGNEVVVRRFPSMIHGFASMSGVSPGARDALIEVGGMLRTVVRG